MTDGLSSTNQRLNGLVLHFVQVMGILGNARDICLIDKAHYRLLEMELFTEDNGKMNNATDKEN